MDKRAGCITLVLFAAALCGCSDKENGAEKTIAEESVPQDQKESANEEAAEVEAQPEILDFVDVFGQESIVTETI